MRTLPLLAALAILATACTDADPGRGTAKACDPCTWDGDCADGFFCDTDGTPPPMVCKTAKMAEQTVACDADCLGTEQCKNDGRCGAMMPKSGGAMTCGPRNAADCQQSDQCVDGGGSACGWCPGYTLCSPCQGK